MADILLKNPADAAVIERFRDMGDGTFARVVAGGLPHLGAYTYATLPAAASWSGYTARASDLGAAPGALVISDGSRWKPIGGRVVLKNQGASSNVANVETIVAQTLIPAGAMAAGDVLSIVFSGTKSGATDNANFVFRIGSAGTTADATMVAGGAAAWMGATALTGAAWHEFQIASATTVQRLGAMSGNGLFGGGGTSSVAAQAAAAIPNVSGALYASLSILSAGATNTLALQNARIDLITG
jgi:hypothetical protein